MRFEQPAFDSIAKRIMTEEYIMTLDDTKEIYIYRDGLYTTRGAVTYIEQRIRYIFCEEFYIKNKAIIDGINSGDGEPFHVTAPKISFIHECVSYIKSYTIKFRDEIDKTNKHLINLKNGMFDINTWQLLSHDPCYFSIRRIPVSYDPGKQCPYISKFLRDVVSSQDQRTLIEFAGYSLIPMTSIQKAVMLYGEGSNGKSKFLELLTKFIGDDNTSGVSLQQLESDKYSVAQLYGKLLNIYPDLKDAKLYSSDLFKTLVGGDRIQGEKKYLDSFWFYNTARLIFSANKIPEVKNKEFAYYRRWLLINFPNSFVGTQEDRHLIDKLTTEDELSGFLNLALGGLRDILSHDGFSYEQSAESVERQYNLHASSAGTFAERFIRMSTDDISKSVLYEHYTFWCQKKQIRSLPPNEFGKKMKALGYEDSRTYDQVNKIKVAIWQNISIDIYQFKIETGRGEVNIEW
jgi:putative DNA primase/helicase